MRQAALLVLLACAPVPPACEAMCEVAGDHVAACLEEREQTWSDRGYEDAADHQTWCKTWVWSQRLLERDAGERGRTVATCLQRAEAIPELSCADYDALDW